MPKRTVAEQLDSSVLYWRQEIQAAYEKADATGQLELPLQTAIRMATSLLSKYAKEDPRDAAVIYDHVTRTLVTQVTAVRARAAAA